MSLKLSTFFFVGCDKMRYIHCRPRLNSENKLKLQRIFVEEEKEAFSFESPYFLGSRNPYDKTDIPLEFKANPESLLNISAKIVNSLPLPDVYQWTTEDVCKWLVRYGYKTYEHTFRVNKVTGRKLLLIDCNALCAMNVRNFHDIKQIAYGIRKLFYFEMTKFMRTISLPSQQHDELYKLFQTKTGYEQVKRSHLWLQLQMLRDKSKYNFHWDILEHWVARIREKKCAELFGVVNK